MTGLKIAFVPIDNRPVSYTLAQQTAEIDKNMELKGSTEFPLVIEKRGLVNI